VPRVDKATEIAASPAYDRIKTSVQGSSDRAQFPQRDRRESALFDAADDEPRHIRDRCDIFLGLPLSDPNRSKRGADLLVVHQRMMGETAYPPIIRGPQPHSRAANPV
jgi:hypothetical protein